VEDLRELVGGAGDDSRIEAEEKSAERTDQRAAEEKRVESHDRVQGTGCRVQGTGSREQGTGCRLRVGGYR
jgi:hypothetical protein